MTRYMLKKPEKIREAMIRQPVHFYVFDILRYKDEDLRGLSLLERKAILAQVLSGNDNFSPVIIAYVNAKAALAEGEEETE
jgi:DNA ligase-1